MIILGIETTCDETGCAILEEKNGSDLPAGRQVQILSNVVASSASLQAKYGGVIPEQAAREQIKSIIPVIQEAIENCKLKIENLDAIAVSYGPGLIGSLLVGVETAKTLSLVWKKPLIPVNHLIGHFYANWISHLPGARAHLEGVPKFPCIGLLVSGGHTDLVLFKDHGKFDYLGGTRDDAAGECFDKCARLLGLPYPGGPEISKLAQNGKDIYHLPRPMIDSKDFEFSFSGLKTAVANLNDSGQARMTISNLAASIEAAIVDVLVAKTIRAAQKYRVEQIMVAGGVAANQKLKQELETRCQGLEIKLHIPPPNLCTDNGAMIAAAAFFQKPISDPLKLQANPNLSLAY